tara:strand:+ start:1642 stop:1785 length:144 start_codon:yes stop_codon:yes gene_type:complete
MMKLRKKRNGVASMNGRKIFFSFLYRPGEIYFQIWMRMRGKEINNDK